jgi:mono/diheme cytochrome c family protein
MLTALAIAVGVPPAFGADPEQGKKLFADQKCSLCHSVEGKGNVKGPLDGVGSKLKPDEIRKWITSPKEMTEQTKATRKPAMKSFALLKAAEVDALVAYLETLKKK